MNLYAGKLLLADLTIGAVGTEPPHWEWIRQYWRSWGLVLHYYRDLVESGVDPLSAGNVVVSTMNQLRSWRLKWLVTCRGDGFA